MLYRQIEVNRRNTVLLVIVFCVVVLVIGAAFGYAYMGSWVTGVVVAGIVLAFYIPISLKSARKRILTMNQAQPLQKQDNPQLYNLVENMAIAANIPMPSIYIIDDTAMNAFATGITPKEGTVVFTKGILDSLNREELEGVVAHEIAHIRNLDIRLMTISIALVGFIIILSDVGRRMMFAGGSRKSKNQSHPIILLLAIIVIILGPILAKLMQLAISRNREYLADASAVEFTRNPEGLKRALMKISGDVEELEVARAESAPMFFSSPFRHDRKEVASLFSTHPSIPSRINRLNKM